MKKKPYILMMSLLISVSLAFHIAAPEVAKDKNKGGVDLKKDFDLAGKAVLKKAKKAAIVKCALHFKTISKGVAFDGKGQNRASAAAYAILDGVSDATRQEIADAFYASFNKKMTDAGLATVDYNTVKSASSFAKIEEKQIDKYWQGKDHGYMQVFTANDAPHNKQVIGNPGIWKAYAKLGKEIEANPVTLDIVIDFAHFNIDVNQRKGRDVITTSASSNVSTGVILKMRSGAIGFNSMTSNFTTVGKYGEAAIISPKKDLYFDGGFENEIKSYNGELPASMKKRVTFGTNLTTGTYVVQADEVKYKTAVMAALDQYSDYLIAKMKEVR